MTEAPTPRKRNILLLAGAGLRASLTEQLARYPEFAVAPAASAQEATRLLDEGGCDIVLARPWPIMGARAQSRKRR